MMKKLGQGIPVSVTERGIDGAEGKLGKEAWERKLGEVRWPF